MTMPDMLTELVGSIDSNGDMHTPDPSLSTDEADVLKHLCDPMQLLKLFAVAHQTGGPDEILNYLSDDALFTDPVQNKSTLLDVARDLQAKPLTFPNHVASATPGICGQNLVEQCTETKKKRTVCKKKPKDKPVSVHNLTAEEKIKPSPSSKDSSVPLPKKQESEVVPITDKKPVEQVLQSKKERQMMMMLSLVLREITPSTTDDIETEPEPEPNQNSSRNRTNWNRTVNPSRNQNRVQNQNLSEPEPEPEPEPQLSQN